MKEEKVTFTFHPIFDFSDYKSYLRAIFKVSGAQRGLRSELAKTLNCQTAFVSGVLNGQGDFGLEHAMRISRFLKHTEEERKYFLLLVQQARAGSKELEQHFRAEARVIVQQRQLNQGRIRLANALSESDRATYYGKWYHSAIHMLTLIPQYRNRSKIASYLNLDPSLVSESVEFLLSCGLLKEDGQELEPGVSRVHIGANSPLAAQQHANWRIRAIQSLDRKNEQDLHYTIVLTLSEKDVKAVEAVLLSAMESVEKILPDSKDEALFSLCLDWVRV